MVGYCYCQAFLVALIERFHLVKYRVEQWSVIKTASKNKTIFFFKMLSSVDHFLLIQGSNRTRNHSELQAAYLQQLLLCTAVVWKTTRTIYSIKLFLTDLLTETTRVCLVAYKQKHFCISDQKAVQWLFTVVLNLTSCYQGNHGCHKIILESEILKITTLIQTNWW